MARNLGTRKIVVHLWGGITSDRNFENNLNAYAKLKAIADKYGIDLLVENVVCNVNMPMEHWCELAERYPGILFVFDTKMAAFHGQLELLYEKEYDWLWKDGHIRHFHVNDYAGKIMEWSSLKSLPIGKGHIDFNRFFKFINSIKYDDTFTLESTAFDNTGAVDVEMINEQVKYIRSKII